MIYELGTKVKCMHLNKQGVVVRNKNIFGMKATPAMQIKFEDGTNKVYLANECDHLITVKDE